MKKPILFPAACAAIVLSLFAVISAQTDANRLKLEPYKFENSKGEVIDAELGRLKVPENRRKKESRAIEIAFVRFRSTSDKPGPPIVYLAGGPGGSGILAARGSRFPLFMEMRKFGDVIALDQRGTGLSEPNLACPGRLELPPDQPGKKESILKTANRQALECAEFWRSKGADIAGYNTLESADDIEALRQALGAKKVRLWGISYGTHLGLATIRRHPASIESAVLAGVEAMDDTLKLPANTDALFDDLSERVKADPKLGKLAPDLAGLMKKVLEKLRKHPVTVTVKERDSGKEIEVVVGELDLAALTAQASGDSTALRLFPALYLGMDSGNFGFVAERMLDFRRQGMPSMMSIAMDCASGASRERIETIREQEKGALLGSAINIPYPEICKGLPVADLGDDFRRPVVSNAPVLFISGTLDGRTPVSNAEAVIPGFRNSSHMIIDGAAHSDDLFLSSPKIAETMAAFFSGMKLPAEIRITTAVPFAFQQP